MSAHTHAFPKKTDRRREQAAAAHREVRWQPEAPSLEPAARGGVCRDVLEFIKKPAAVLGLAAVVVFAVAYAGAWVLRYAAPQTTVTVQEFEISQEATHGFGITGKGTSDLVIDRLNRVCADGKHFQGAEYYTYDHQGAQPIALDETIHVPVESTYGFELNGISIDSVIKLFKQARYKQWIVSGDVMPAKDGLTVRIRVNEGGAAGSWETLLRPGESPAAAVQASTDAMLTAETPELLGRAFLAEGKPKEAETVFRQWALSSAHTWRPYYYLGMALDYQTGKEQEAKSVARWSRVIAEHERVAEATAQVQSREQISTPERLAEITQIAWETREGSGTAAMPAVDKKVQLARLRHGVEMLTESKQGNQGNLTFKTQQAKILDKEAVLELSLDPTSKEATATESQAVNLLGEAVSQLPGNGGLYEQRGVMLQHLVAIERSNGEAESSIRENQSREIADFQRALEIQPTRTSPLWGVLYAMIDAKRSEEAVDLARVILVLQPDSATVRAAYVVALEYAMRDGGKDEEREAEVKLQIASVARAADQSELEAIWFSCAQRGDVRSMRELAVVGRRRFPQDATFRGGAVGPAAAAKGIASARGI